MNFETEVLCWHLSSLNDLFGHVILDPEQINGYAAKSSSSAEPINSFNLNRLKGTIYLVWLIHCSTYLGAQETGIVHDSIYCISNQEQSYALYLPTYYSPELKWPIIYIFEPAARGVLPTTLFSQAAEKWGYIIVGSNNSRNGSWPLVFDAANAMFDDTHARFSINPERIYTSGFSGGARSAIAVATLTGQVNGIIGCGAGSPGSIEYRLNSDNKVPYVGIVADKDMNYLEVKDQEKDFNSIGIENIRLTWSGIHEWPPSHLIDKAVQWLEYSTNAGVSETDQLEIERNFKEYRDSLYHSGNYSEAIRMAKYLKRDMKIEIPAEFVEVEQSKAYRKSEKAIMKMEDREKFLKQKFYEEARKIQYNRLVKTDSTNPIFWWKTEIDKLKRKLETEDSNRKLMVARLLNHIWASNAERSFSYERRNDYEMALRTSEIWLHAQPESVWALWYRAKLFALVGDQESAMNHLEKAYENGMSKVQSIKNYKEFDVLKTNNRYAVLIAKLSGEQN